MRRIDTLNLVSFEHVPGQPPIPDLPPGRPAGMHEIMQEEYLGPMQEEYWPIWKNPINSKIFKM